MTSTSANASKKRKRATSPARRIAFKLAEHQLGSDEVGPTLVSFPSLEAPPSTAFKCYRKKTKTSPDAAEDIIVAGETDFVEFESNAEESERVSHSGCKYLVAVHNKRTGELSVLPTLLSPHVLTQTVKALKSIEPAPAPTALEYFQARTALGETFGTKKAKAAIKARERNRVDVGAMEGVMDHVMAGIDKAAGGLMTAEEAQDLADTNRAVPPFDAEATDPADVYPLHGIITEPEWKALSVNTLLQAGTAADRKKCLPFWHSEWVNTRLEASLKSSEKKRNLKILFYMSAMMAFRRVTDRKFKKEDISAKIPTVPSVVIDSLMDRFTECARGSTEPRTTPHLQLLLLTHLLALSLRIDNYAADFGTLARDLSISNEKMATTFRSLGCKIVTLTEKQRTKLGLPDSVADERRAVLEVPLKFPQPRLKQRSGR